MKRRSWRAPGEHTGGFNSHIRARQTDGVEADYVRRESLTQAHASLLLQEVAWTIQGSKPNKSEVSWTRRDHPRCPDSLLCNGTGFFFPRCKAVVAWRTPSTPLLAPSMCRAMPLLTLPACLVYYGTACTFILQRTLVKSTHQSVCLLVSCLKA